MLNRNMHNLYADNDDKGTPSPATSQGNLEDKGKTYTQAEFDAEQGRIAAKEKREAKAATEKAILERFEKLGAKSLEEVEALLSSHAAKQEAEKTELQKALDAVVQAKQETAAALQRAVELEKQSRIDKRDSVLSNLLVGAHNAAAALIDLKARYADKVNALISESGEVDSVQAEKLIAEYKAQNGYQFKGDSKGSPSNADGRLLKPQGEVREEIEKEIKRKIRF